MSIFPKPPSKREPTAAERRIEALPDAEPVRLSLRFTGYVQGVGFRYTQLNVAGKHDVAGWVRNMDDGSVEASWQGTGAALKAMLAEIRSYYGRFGAAFSVVRAEPQTLQDEKGFEVRY